MSEPTHSDDVTVRSAQLLVMLVPFDTACYDTTSSMDKWLSKLESSSWLSHVKDILTCACVAAQCIDKEGKSWTSACHSDMGEYSQTSLTRAALIRNFLFIMIQ